MNAPANFAPMMANVATRLLGEPTQSKEGELRWGNKGSLSIDLAKGAWFDHEADKGGGVLDLIRRERGCDKGAAIDWLKGEGLLRDDNSAAPIFYDYRDEAGTVRYRVERRGTGANRKFVQHGADGRGGFVCRKGCMDGVTRLAYRLPELLASIGPVFVTEGEKDADRLASLGLVATCNSGGAGKFGADLAPYFDGRRVVILQDNDLAGREHAQDVRRKLAAVADCAILALPGLPAKGDVSDWLDAGGTVAGLIELGEAALDVPAHDPDTGEILDDEAPQDDAPRATGFEFVRAGDFKFRPPEWLIDEVMETDTMGLLFGDPGCCKSFVAIDACLAIATGTPFHGRSVKQSPVFLIAGEGHNGLSRRFAAWAKDRDVSIKDAPLFVSKRPAQFLDAESAKEVAEAVRQLAAKNGNPALIVIDTLARNFGPGDENSTSDMGAFIAAVDDLKAGFPSCAALIVHHSGHADKQRARGAMAMKGALDCEYRVEKTEGVVRVTNTKMKDAEPPKPMAFNLKSVDLGEGVASAVLMETEAKIQPKGMTPAQKIARDTYMAAAVTGGLWDDDGFAGLHLDEWRAAFNAKHTADNAGAKRKAFQRVRVDLQGAGLLSVDDDVYRWNDEAVTGAIIRKRGSGTDGTRRDNVAECHGAEADRSGTDGTRA